MRSTHKMALACAAGMLIGAGATSALMAQGAAVGQAYLIANVTEITDPAGFKEYQDGVAKSQVPFGGHGIVRAADVVSPGTQDPSWMAGAPKARLTIIAFPSMEKLKAWWASPEYDHLRVVRERATKGTIYAVEGLPPS